MYYDRKIRIADSDGTPVCILPNMANRHGLIAGATGTGKTTTLKVLAESFSDAGVPVFISDIKGDLAGMCRMGELTESLQRRIERFGLNELGFAPKSYPCTFWDVEGKCGIPLRTTISEMGPMLLARLLDLTPGQADILTIAFKIADDNGLLLYDTKDLKSMLQYIAENSTQFSAEYGNIAKASINVILRGVVALEARGGEHFFTEPALNITDFFRTEDGRGMMNILDCRSLVSDPTMYTTFLLWLLSELFEVLPEVGDLEKPRMVFFFDEAHLLFKNISKALQEKLEQVVKLIRSKGVSIFFITQNPKDIPDVVLSQLGNKIQHALRAYTPAEEKAVNAAARSFRANPAFDTKQTLLELGTGEALISVLDEHGIPTVVQRCAILPPQSLMSTIPDEEKVRAVLIDNLYLKYKDPVDPESAYELLMRLKDQITAEQEEERRRLAEEKEAEKQAIAEQRAAERAAAAEQKAAERLALAEQRAAEKAAALEAKAQERAKAQQEKAVKNSVKSVGNSVVGTIGRELGKNLGNAVGGKFGKTLGGNLGASLGRSILGTFLKG